MTKSRFFRIASSLLVFISLHCNAYSQQQPLQSFGYVGIADYLRSHPGQHIAADWDFINSDPPPWNLNAVVNLQSTFQLLQNNIGALNQPRPLKAFIDLGGVFWIRDLNSPDSIRYKLRDDAWDRWSRFVYAQGTYFSSAQIGQYVLAFNIANEPGVWGIPMSDVQWAASLVKFTFPNIPTAVIEWGSQVADPNYAPSINYQLADFVDWWGIDAYGIHPNATPQVHDAMATFRNLMASLPHSQKKLFYATDGFFDSDLHSCFAKRDMPGIAQEWFNVATNDPDAILAGVFLLPDLDSNAIGSASLGTDTLEKQAHIWQSIRDHKIPAYQARLNDANCQTISGWAWDSNQSDNSLLGSQGYLTNPAYLDLFIGTDYIRSFPAKLQQSTVSADPVVGNGFHGFSIPLPDEYKYGVAQTYHVRISGTNIEIPGSPRQLTCSAPNWSPTQLANGRVNTPYSQSIWPFPNPEDYYFLVVTGHLPSGLSVNPQGVVTGIPTSSGSFQFSLQVTLSGTNASFPNYCDGLLAKNVFQRIYNITINP